MLTQTCLYIKHVFLLLTQKPTCISLINTNKHDFILTPTFINMNTNKRVFIFLTQTNIYIINTNKHY